jgi:GNAT superfamily N-acetyltransferase
VSEARRIQTRALRDFLRWLGCASPGASVVEMAGVTGAVVPAAPQRSVVNSVAYEDPSALADSYDALKAAYADAGVAAWTVWTPEQDQDAIELLTRKGHALDGQPAAMTLGLAGFEQPDPGDLDWDSDATYEEVGRLNDEAYGHADSDGFAPAIAGPPERVSLRRYRARVGGKTACALITADHEDDLGIYFVATGERYRGRGLTTRLLAVALAEARGRGLRTSSLQSTAKGKPVYERLGYREHFRLHMYERRG